MSVPLASRQVMVGLRKEAAHVLGKEERPRVSEEQCAIRPFGRLDVDQYILDLRPAGDAGKTEPGVELLAVEILRIDEPRAGRQIKSDSPFEPEQVADFVAAQFLGDRALAPEEAIAALHREVY